VRGRIHELEAAVLGAERGWRYLDLAPLFPRWIARHELFDDLIRMPDELPGLLPDFGQAAIAKVRDALQECAVTDLLALSGCGALFGLMRVSTLVSSSDDSRSPSAFLSRTPQGRGL
jgi:hypothetical protein